MRFSLLTPASLLLVTLAGAGSPLRSQPSPRDASAHRVRFVTVDSAVRLEVLDWGGSGRPLVLLAGGEQTAHDFDQLAPKLAADHHVYGITRRGAGLSSRPVFGYESDRLGDDVLAVLDSLRLVRPVLAGHSRAGAELSSVGSRYPERVAGLIYLDAGYYYAFYDTAHGQLELDNLDVQRKLQQIRQLGFRGPLDQRRLDSLFTELLDHDLPVLTRELRELRQDLATRPDTNAPLPAVPSWGSGSAIDKIWQGARKYSAIRVPILALYAEIGWKSTPSSADRFQGVFPHARVVRLSNSEHYVWRTNEAEVLREMRAFIDGLPRTGSDPAARRPDRYPLHGTGGDPRSSALQPEERGDESDGGEVTFACRHQAPRGGTAREHGSNTETAAPQRKVPPRTPPSTLVRTTGHRTAPHHPPTTAGSIQNTSQ